MMDMNQLQQACYALLEAEEHIYDNVYHRGERGESVQQVEERVARTGKSTKNVLPKAVGCALACAAGFVLTSRGMTGWLPQLLKFGGGAGALVFGASAVKSMRRHDDARSSLEKAKTREEINRDYDRIYAQEKAAARAAYEQRYLRPLLNFAAQNPPPEGTKLFFQIPVEECAAPGFDAAELQELGRLSRDGRHIAGFAAPEAVQLNALEPYLTRPDCECFYVNQALADPDPARRYTLSFIHHCKALPLWKEVEHDRGGQVNVEDELRKFAGSMDDRERSRSGGQTRSDQYYSGSIGYGSYAVSQQRREKAMNEARSAMESYNASRSYTSTECWYVELFINTLGVVLRNEQGQLVCAAAFRNGLESTKIKYALPNRMHQDTPKAEQQQILAALTGTVIEEDTSLTISDKASAPASMMRYIVWKCAADLPPYNPLELKHPGLSDGAFRYWHKIRYQLAGSKV